ncbi:MAG TPA: signal peptidase II [Egibacteraceae bacterium]|nr:signal peptidase II [Egibacteraceae bacterium]
MSATEIENASDATDDPGEPQDAASPESKRARKEQARTDRDARRWRARQERDGRKQQTREGKAEDAKGRSARRKDTGPPPRRALPGRLVYVTTFVVAAMWVVLDQATKVLAVEGLPETAVGGQLGPFDLRLVRNPGGAFGIPGFPALFLIVTVLVIVLVVRALPRTDRLLLAAAYGLVSGGALGNVIDRLARQGDGGFGSGHVVDFLDLGWWPVFNLADVGIVVGAVAIAVLLTIVDREERAAEAERAQHRSVRPESVAPPQ